MFTSENAQYICWSSSVIKKHGMNDLFSQIQVIRNRSFKKIHWEKNRIFMKCFICLVRKDPQYISVNVFKKDFCCSSFADYYQIFFVGRVNPIPIDQNDQKCWRYKIVNVVIYWFNMAKYHVLLSSSCSFTVCQLQWQ